MASDENKDSTPENSRTVVDPTGVSLFTPSDAPRPQTTIRPGAIPEGGIDRTLHRHIQVGDVLNHIFEVKRFIARGGMGEVFEGINVNSDERVAIKVMLPSLAADANVLAMFRKEARTLTRLNHPALVQYRVLAQEPQLGVFYIVTEYVDGKNLSDVISALDPSPQDLIQLTRRLAGGLEAAHALGAIHRDISPDNVMLEDGLLSGARIIDFGIAKDLNAGSATIIGDGFAGKLNYVAPEQLGDFNRSIGPWTDIYSLGLVILAVALRKDVPMGGTLVDAVDKRRAGPDLSQAPEILRPLLTRMVKPNPEERPRSMTEVLELLPMISAAPPVKVTPVKETKAKPQVVKQKPSQQQPEKVEKPVEQAVPAKTPPPASPPPPGPPPPPPPPPPAPPSSPPVTPVVDPPVDVAPPVELPSEPAMPVAELEPVPLFKDRTDEPKDGRKSHKPVAAGIAAALVLAAAGLWFGLFANKTQPDSATPVAADSGPEQVAETRAALNSGLAAIGCSWLNVADVSQGGRGIAVVLRGVASKPADVQTQIAAMLASKKLNVATINIQDVAAIDAAECAPMDALRQIRDVSGSRMSVPQRQFEMAKMTHGSDAGSLGAEAVINFDLSDPNPEMALFGMEPSGKIAQLTADRAELIAGSQDLGNGRYQLALDVNHTGWSGLLLLTGNKPFEGQLLAGPPGSRNGDWSQRFLSIAKERGWKSEMVWFKTVDEAPD